MELHLTATACGVSLAVWDHTVKLLSHADGSSVAGGMWTTTQQT